MAIGADARVAISKETTYGTRVAPARFVPLTAEDLGFTVNRYFSPVVGIGRWARPSVVTTKVGSGSLSGDVPSTGFGFLLQGLHGNTVTPVQQAATPAYLQTHTLDTPPDKSFSIQVGTPPTTSNTLVPHEMWGAMMGGITLSWSTAGVLSYSIPIVYQNLDTAQTLISYVAPAAYGLFGFQGGKIEIGGVLEANITGDGSITLGSALRDDVFALGSSGLIAKPTEADKPTAGGSFTADFTGNTNLTRTLNNTIADVVMTFEGVVINSAHKEMLSVTLPDCVFTTGRATVSGPGPLTQAVEFTSASSTNDPPVILYKSVDTVL
jgi:hypothetical protein